MVAITFYGFHGHFFEWASSLSIVETCFKIFSCFMFTEM